jgi:hypothetical protein
MLSIEARLRLEEVCLLRVAADFGLNLVTRPTLYVQAIRNIEEILGRTILKRVSVGIVKVSALVNACANKDNTNPQKNTTEAKTIWKLW